MKSFLTILQSLFSVNSAMRGEIELKPFTEVAETVKYVKSFKGSASELRLPISETLNDVSGVNLSIILNSVLEKGFDPDGFVQKEGYKIYKYK